MNAFRTRLNVLGLEGRDMPSANPAAIVAQPAPEPTHLRVVIYDALVTSLAAGNRPSGGGRSDLIVFNPTTGSPRSMGGDGVRDLLIFNGNGAAARQTSGAGKVVMQDIHFATGGDDVIYVGTANGGVWKTTNGGGAAVKSGFGYATLTVGGATHASTGDADLDTRIGQRPTS